jgi:predicted O-methyltransferase YrrM
LILPHRIHQLGVIRMKRLEHIRPYQVLGINDEFAEEIRFFMPPAQGAGSLLSIESLLLIKLMRITQPRYLFEFGTYKGLTTRLLLANLPPSADASGERIYTLDLPNLDDVHFQGTDVDLAREALGFDRKYAQEQNRHLVKQILHDSMKFDGSQYPEKFQFIFIDANHEVAYARRDTENSLKMFSRDKGCLIWHDYGHPEFPELTQYIEDLGTQMDVYHVEHTKLAFHPRGFEIKPR